MTQNDVRRQKQAKCQDGWTEGWTDGQIDGQMDRVGHKVACTTREDVKGLRPLIHYMRICVTVGPLMEKKTNHVIQLFEMQQVD